MDFIAYIPGSFTAYATIGKHYEILAPALRDGKWERWQRLLATAYGGGVGEKGKNCDPCALSTVPELSAIVRIRPRPVPRPGA